MEIITVIKWVLGILVGVPLFLMVIYLASSMQMAGWIDTFTRKINKLNKTKTDEKDKKEK